MNDCSLWASNVAGTTASGCADDPLSGGTSAVLRSE